MRSKLFGGLAIMLLTAHAQAATDYPSGYTKCAKEGAACAMTGTRSVSFGKSGVFVYATLSGSFTCQASLFPSSTHITGTRYCSYAAAASSSAAASSVAASSAAASSAAKSSVAASSAASSAATSVATSSKAASSAVASSAAASSVVASSAATSGKYVEKLGRGAVAVPAASGMLVSWRLLGTESASTGFNVYRGSVKLNSSPITASTNYQDSTGSTGSAYTVKAVVNGVEQAGSNATVFANPYLSIPLSKPAGGTTPDGVAYTYDANDGSVADLDGDGEYEIVLKWQPTNSKDNSQSGYTGNTFIDAYKFNGTRLWRIDLGKNIRAGAHYTQMVVYDLDSDGKAELMLKTADGTIDGKGTLIGSGTADYRNSAGYILSGPEYLTVFNGATGAAMATTNYLPARGTVSSWGDSYGNRVDRFLAGVAYLDGTRPSAVFSRGYYTRAVLVAWDWRDGKLTQRWTHDSPTSGSGAYGQGAHYFTVGDVNKDGKDDIIYGAATIGSDGKLLYRTGLGHGDALHMSDLDPNRSGQEVFMVHEETGAAYGMEMHDAASGKILWGVKTGVDTGRGMCADIDPAFPGYECWSSVGGIYSATGVSISSSRPSINFGIWWDGDLSRELLDGVKIDKWVPASSSVTRLVTGANAASNNSTKANPVISADLFGDWREEVIWRNTDNSALLIYSTAIPTGYRFPTLMHDPQYRVQVAGQNMAYNQPPHPSFFLGNGMGTVSLPAIRTP
ncbi:rhamnogalacturonan lyase [Uliginosibacterium sp. 31-12]|uniref:rhamnogalacturonan lyase n=1 Tax=Uliginosibacterium sp. 31-12 TaxID=3062781 RepID=UPI0026E35EAF|nr:rhamnogalacturonan lyase [Uliginosibacterium sp. 31-12]MDO6386258.1 rhamnogalacturonan lyase [Uliginosibacterium sp. 31-12]